MSASAPPPSPVPLSDWKLPQQEIARQPKRGRQPALHIEQGQTCLQQNGTRTVRASLLRNLYRGRDPFKAVDAARFDHRYPHSNLRASFVKALLLSLPAPRFWLEVGSFVGNSIVTTVAVAAHLCLVNLTVVSIDPFAGDTAMWDFQKLIRGNTHPPFGYDFLQLTADGRPTVRDRFMANVLHSGAAPWVVPITIPGVSGLRLLNQLRRGVTHAPTPLGCLPDVIYLDSAHESGETMLELKLAFQVLEPGGALFGDDWNWDAVRKDVVAFARTIVQDRRQISQSAFLRTSAEAGQRCTTMERHRTPWLTVCEPGGTWILFKAGQQGLNC